MKYLCVHDNRAVFPSRGDQTFELGFRSVRTGVEVEDELGVDGVRRIHGRRKDILVWETDDEARKRCQFFLWCEGDLRARGEDLIMGRTPGAVGGIDECIHGRVERGLGLEWGDCWPQIGGSIEKEDVDGDGEQGKEGEEGGALQPLPGDEGLAYGEPRATELGGRGKGRGVKPRGVKWRFGELAYPWRGQIEHGVSPVD